MALFDLDPSHDVGLEMTRLLAFECYVFLMAGGAVTPCYEFQDALYRPSSIMIRVAKRMARPGEGKGCVWRFVHTSIPYVDVRQGEARVVLGSVGDRGWVRCSVGNCHATRQKKEIDSS